MISRMFKKMVKRGISYPLYIFHRRGPAHKNGFRILLYHSVGPCEKNDYMGLKITQKEFLRQMEFLKENKFVIYRLSELVEKLIDNTPMAPNSVAITFDDGYKDVLTYAVPILKEFGYTATIFMTADYIGAYMRPADIKDYWKGWHFLSTEDLQLLKKNGFSVESHSTDFANLQKISGEQIARSITNSKDNLEKKLAKKITLFSYPSGETNKNVRSVLKETGFKAAACSFPGYNDAYTDLFMLRRTEINAWDGILDFRLKVFGYYDWVRHLNKLC